MVSRSRLGTSAVTGDQSLSTELDMQSSSAIANFRAINSINSENGDKGQPFSSLVVDSHGIHSRGVTSPSSILRPRTTGVATVVDALASHNPNRDHPITFNRTVMSLS